MSFVVIQAMSFSYPTKPGSLKLNHFWNQSLSHLDWFLLRIRYSYLSQFQLLDDSLRKLTTRLTFMLFKFLFTFYYYVLIFDYLTTFRIISMLNWWDESTRFMFWFLYFFWYCWQFRYFLSIPPYYSRGWLFWFFDLCRNLFNFITFHLHQFIVDELSGVLRSKRKDLGETTQVIIHILISLFDCIFSSLFFFFIV